MFGAIFVGLKYKLDQASYHRSLFEERYAIFLKIDGILSASFQGEDKDGKKMSWRGFSKELDFFYRKSYFLFSDKTYHFISEFRKAVINLSSLQVRTPDDKKVNEAREFLQKLIDGQNLSKNFPELKIDSYKIYNLHCRKCPFSAISINLYFNFTRNTKEL